MPVKRKAEEVALYDYTNESKNILRYVGRLKSYPDPGVARYENDQFTVKDNLCKMLYAEILTGQALIDATTGCPPIPEDFIFPDRFIKPKKEHD